MQGGERNKFKVERVYHNVRGIAVEQEIQSRILSV